MRGGATVVCDVRYGAGKVRALAVVDPPVTHWCGGRFAGGSVSEKTGPAFRDARVACGWLLSLRGASLGQAPQRRVLPMPMRQRAPTLLQ